MMDEPIVAPSPYSEIEKQILEYLPPGDEVIRKLFDDNRNNDDDDKFIHACGNVPILQFEETANVYRNASIIEDYRGTVTVHDMRCYGKDIEEETTGNEPLTEDGLKFGLLKVMRRHSTLYKMTSNIMVLGLNPCGILTGDFDLMRYHVQEIVNTEDGIQNFFIRQSILLPIFFQGHSFCILVCHPLGILNPNIQCTIVNVGTGDMEVFKQIMWERTMCILEAFKTCMGFRGTDQVLTLRRIITRVPKMSKRERPFQLLFMVDRILLNRNSILEYAETMMKKLGNNERRMIADIRFLRCLIADEIYSDHLLDGNELSRYMMEKRNLSMYNRKVKREEDIEAGRYGGPSHIKWPAIYDTGESPSEETDDVNICVLGVIND